MKKFLTSTKTVIALLIVSVLALGFYTYMLVRPVSYGMGYHNVTEYEGATFEGTMKFYSDKKMVNTNTNFEEEMESRYYYKDGYLFFTMAETDEEYEKEVAMIDEKFDEAVKAPFYSAKVNAFKLVVGEGVEGVESIVYTCKPAITFAIIGGIVELILIGFACTSIVLWKKSKSQE